MQEAKEILERKRAERDKEVREKMRQTLRERLVLEKEKEEREREERIQYWNLDVGRW